MRRKGRHAKNLEVCRKMRGIEDKGGIQRKGRHTMKWKACEEWGGTQKMGGMK